MTLYGRKCEITRRSGTSGASYRASIEGIEESALRNKGYARDFPEGKEIINEALAAAKLGPTARSGSGGAGSTEGAAANGAPSAVDIRARCLDTAVKFMDAMAFAPVSSKDDIARRLGEVKAIALNFEKFVLSAAEADNQGSASGALS